MNFSMVPEIDVYELARKLKSDESFVLLDVREASELDYAMIVDSRLKVVPLSRLAQFGIEALPQMSSACVAASLIMPCKWMHQ